MFKVGDIVSNNRELVVWNSENHENLTVRNMWYILAKRSFFIVTAFSVEPGDIRVSLLPILQDVGWADLQYFDWVNEDAGVNV